VNGYVSWYDAAAYCNWLSEQEEIPKGEWCYEPNQAGKYAEGMKLTSNYLHRTGYRLPTEAEWEYACRARTDTRYAFGESAEVMGKYACFLANSLSRTYPVGMFKPNDFGLWDMHGNLWEWTQDAYIPFTIGGSGKVSWGGTVIGLSSIEEKEGILSIADGVRDSRVLRGGSFISQMEWLRCTNNTFVAPGSRASDFGFRPSRTLPPSRDP
jgi:formylglycine-generating enzyme required for sulfatase activity